VPSNATHQRLAEAGEARCGESAAWAGYALPCSLVTMIAINQTKQAN